jgi:hypothetical protein
VRLGHVGHNDREEEIEPSSITRIVLAQLELINCPLREHLQQVQDGPCVHVPDMLYSHLHVFQKVRFVEPHHFAKVNDLKVPDLLFLHAKFRVLETIDHKFEKAHV